MKKVTTTESRKADHIKINLEEDVSSKLTNGLENYRFLHEALPNINLDEITLDQLMFGKLVQLPLLISSMTGGTEQAATINANLAIAAQETGIAMGVGSQRAAIEDPGLASTFQVRRYAPDILLFANLGAVQLNYGFDLQECQRAVEMIEADALILHLNSLQEAIQPEGDTRFKGLLTKLERVTKNLAVPVIAKEVGWGISASTAKRLADAGVAAIDVAGAGGTSWSQVEMHRAKSVSQARIAEQFINWGIPTAESIIQVRESVPEIPIIASGGLRTGMDIAKTIALGARIGGMASPFLKVATQSEREVIELIRETGQLIRTIMFGAGVKDLTELNNPNLLARIN